MYMIYVPYDILEDIKLNLELKRDRKQEIAEAEMRQKHQDATWQGKNLLDCCLLDSGGVIDYRPGLKEIEAFIIVQKMRARGRKKHVLHEMSDEWWDLVIKEAIMQENMIISWRQKHQVISQ